MTDRVKDGIPPDLSSVIFGALKQVSLDFEFSIISSF
jgi:hypothetical protein